MPRTLAVAALIATSTVVVAAQEAHMVVQTRSGTKTVTLPSSTFGPPVARSTPLPPPVPRARTDAMVDHWLASRTADDRVTVLVTLYDEHPFPTLPGYVHDVPRDHPRNMRIQQQREQILAAHIEQRTAAHKAWLARRRGWFVHHESFASADTMNVATTIGGIRELLADPDVQYIETDAGGESPPATTLNGRQLMRTDWWVDYVFPLSGNRDVSWLSVALLDSGVRASHYLLTDRIRYNRDCVHGTTGFCTQGTGISLIDVANHGTATAAVIAGADTVTFGNAYRGVTRYRVDSYKVFGDDRTLDRNAVLRAFDAARMMGCEVIVAEIQAIASENGCITTAAESAATAPCAPSLEACGMPVMAAIGNYGPSGAIAAPANGRNVMGIGAYDATTFERITSDSGAPLPDGRIKPDVLAPTDVQTASNVSDTSLGPDFNATSGATAFAGGFAAVGYNKQYDSWSAGGLLSDGVPMSGRIYADMIACGDLVPISHTQGAGHLREVTSWEELGQYYAGNVVFNSTTGSADIEIPANYRDPSMPNDVPYRIDAAIWWSEPMTQQHQEIDLWLADANGVTKAQSYDATSVFQKVRYESDGTLTGNWHLRFASYGIPAAPVRVYWVAHVWLH
jgi:hypothetical protein